MAEQIGLSLQQLGIPPEFSRYVDRSAPAPIKMMAARGLVPASPRVLVALLYTLTLDPDLSVAAAAEKGLEDYPLKLIEVALDETLPSVIIDWLALHRQEEEHLQELILLRKQTSDETLHFLAERVPERLLTILSNNQERLLRSPSLFFSIQQNPDATPGLVDRVLSFLKMNGITPKQELADIPEPEGEFHFPPELIVEPKGDIGSVMIAAMSVASHVAAGTPVEEKQKNLWGTIMEMGTGEKIKLAFTGNAMARGILIRDSNKMVATAVMKSPRLTDPEILAIAQNRNVCDDVLRILAAKKEWLRKYPVKVALVNNPKCPPAAAIALVPQLAVNDLKNLSKNRNVGTQISKRAKETLKARAK